jgi:hypothetical protein
MPDGVDVLGRVRLCIVARSEMRRVLLNITRRSGSARRGESNIRRHSDCEFADAVLGCSGLRSVDLPN